MIDIKDVAWEDRGNAMRYRWLGMLTIGAWPIWPDVVLVTSGTRTEDFKRSVDGICYVNDSEGGMIIKLVPEAAVPLNGDALQDRY